tara:strand:+ start:1039 stop:1479 length:441 start_codon:yes stop_codon:yes gene_type:complete
MSTDSSFNSSTPSVKHAKETFDFVEDEHGNVHASFSTAPGRGYGKSTIPLEDMEGYINFMQKIIDGEIVLTEHESDDMIDIAKSTIKEKNGIVSFKTANGRGTKPTRILKKDMSRFIKFLKKSQREIEEYKSSQELMNDDCESYEN